jgi:hypothetical protein
MGFSDAELDALVAITVTCSVISLFGSLTIIICYLYFDEMRTFAFRLVFFVSLSDFLACLFRMFGNPKSTGWCDLQGFGTNLFDLTSFCWAAAIAVIINFVRSRYERFEAENFILKCHIIIWPLCLTLSVLPFFSNSYGPAGGWCWIKDSNKTLDNVWRIVCFYIIFLVVFCHLLYVYSQLYRYLNKGDEIPDEAQSLLKKVMFFPMVLFFCYFFAFVRRLLEVCGNDDIPFWLAVLHAGPSSLLGFGNAIVYGAVNNILRQQIMEMCCTCSTLAGNTKLSKEPCIQLNEVNKHRKTADSTVEVYIEE